MNLLFVQKQLWCQLNREQNTFNILVILLLFLPSVPPIHSSCVTSPTVQPREASALLTERNFGDKDRSKVATSVWSMAVLSVRLIERYWIVKEKQVDKVGGV